MDTRHIDTESPEAAERSWAAGLDGAEPAGRPEGYVAFAGAFKQAFQQLGQLGTQFRQFCAEKDTSRRTTTLGFIQDNVRTLRTTFGDVHLEILGAFTACLGKLFSSLGQQVLNPNPSVLRTTSNAIDFLRFALSNVQYRSCLEKLPLKVLIAEDDPVCRRAMLLALGIGDMKITACEDGEKALEVLGSETFDVVFTDIMMPGLDGLEMTRQLRQLAHHRTTPVIFVTALSDFEVRARSLLCGGCDFIAKPIIPSELVVKAFSFALRHRVVLEMAARANGNAHVSEPDPVERHLGVLHVDATNRIRRGNKDIPALLGFDPADLVGKLVTEVFPDDAQEPGVSEKVGELLSRGVAKSSVTLRAKGKDGAVIPVLATCRETTHSGEKIHLLLLRSANPPKSDKGTAACSVSDNLEPLTSKPGLQLRFSIGQILKLLPAT
jgi:PAS domain S-box-containing protein